MKMTNHIAEKRLKLGLTQQQLADKMGWTLRKIESYERNQRKPPLPEAIQLAKVLKTKVEDLFTVIEDDRPTVIALPDPPIKQPKTKHPKMEKGD